MTTKPTGNNPDPLASVREGVALAARVEAIRARRAPEVATQHAAMQRQQTDLRLNTQTLEAALLQRGRSPAYSDGYSESAVLGTNKAPSPRRIELDWRGPHYVPTRFPELHRQRAQEPLEWPNAGLVRECLQIVQRGGILALYGIRGGGKTQLALDLALAAELHPAYFTAATLLHWRKQWWELKKQEELYNVRLLGRVPLLVIDEIQERVRGEYDDKFLTGLIDERYREQMPTVLISNLLRPEFESHLGPSATSRVTEFGAFVEIVWGNFRELAGQAGGER
jgi:hypothetical protein